MTVPAAKSSMSMRAKNGSAVFVCQVLPGLLKIIKCSTDPRGEVRLLDFFVEPLPPDAEAAIDASLRKGLKKMGFRSDSVVLSLPVNNVTCRFLKVPTQDPGEIQRIADLQAASYLPYAPRDLVTAYQAVAVDAQGYTSINLVIAPRELILRHLRRFKDIGSSSLTIVLSSYGLVSFFTGLKQKNSETLMLVEIDRDQVEVAIAKGSKLLLSRYFKIPADRSQLESLFLEEIRKTKKAYFKEVSDEDISKIYVFCPDSARPHIRGVLSAASEAPFEFLSYAEGICADQAFARRLLESDCSFVSLLGFGIRRIFEDGLTLMPEETKRALRDRRYHKKRAMSVLAFFAIAVLFLLGSLQGLRNKAAYLAALEAKILPLEEEAEVLDAKDQYLRLLERRIDHGDPVIGIIFEVHQLFPEGMELESLGYDAGKNVVLNGTAGELRQVLSFATALERSSAFQGYKVVIKKAAKTTNAAGGVSFVIKCISKDRHA